MALSLHSECNFLNREQIPRGSTPRGFTLIELVLVIGLVALISSFVATRFSVITGWKHEGELRKFTSTWQFLFAESYGRAETYRLVLDLDENSYYVLREVALERDEIQNVDYLKNLRTRREKERRKEDELEDLQTLNEEFTSYDRRQSGPIDLQFYDTKFKDVYADVRLARPLEFPKLAEKQFFSEGLDIKDVLLQGASDEVEEGEVIFRFTPQGSSEFAVIHFQIGEDQFFTAVSHPATGNLTIKSGIREYKWNPQANEVN